VHKSGVNLKKKERKEQWFAFIYQKQYHFYQKQYHSDKLRFCASGPIFANN